MFHLNYLKKGAGLDGRDVFLKRASGRYYTGELAGRSLARRVATSYHRSHRKGRSIRVIDPFGGDGRLLEWLIEAWTQLGYHRVRWSVTIWDMDTVGFDAARTRLTTESGHVRDNPTASTA